MPAANPVVVLHAIGDVAPDRPEPSDCFDLARETLKDCDIGFCQLECNLTERGFRLPQVRHTHRSTIKAAHAMKDAGMQVVSFCGNHCLDWGPEGFFDTIDNLKAAGLDPLGVGADIAEARRPVIKSVNGVRVAFLAYTSILPAHYWAEAKRPGCVPMRAHTIYEQIETDQPGTPARVHTFAHRDDLAAMEDDIRRAKADADVVVMSIHWGIHFVPAVIADYQREVAHAAIDAGCDLILGGHAHILKGVEVYRGKTIFYSLCNFAMDIRIDREHAKSKGFREIQALSPGWEPDYDSLYGFPPDTRMTVVVRAELTKDGVREVSVRPAFINRDAQAEILDPADARFGQVVDYLRWTTDTVGFNARFEPAGPLVRITEAGPARAEAAE